MLYYLLDNMLTLLLVAKPHDTLEIYSLLSP